MMATRPASASHRGARVDWRAAMKRALRRSAEIGGAIVLIGAMVFLALALMSYHQTDPSASTAAAGPAQNWMGETGAWVAERALFLFGWTAILLLPMLYVMARKLWRLVEEEDEDLPHADHAWWRPLGLLALAMALIGTTVSLWISADADMPAGWGGIAGLAGAGLVSLAASFAPEAYRWLFAPIVGLVTLGAGAIIAGRVFAFDWGSLFTLPGFLKRRPALPERIASAIPVTRSKKERDAAATAPVPLGEPRKAPRDHRPGPRRQARADHCRQPPGRPVRQVRAARARPAQRCPGQFRAQDRQAGAGAQRPPARNRPRRFQRQGRDYRSSHRPGRHHVRAGARPRHQVQPRHRPGDDIARNMSAISARVSSIPGRTVMGIELPNADRQMVSFKELVACEAFAGSKGALPIILGKDIAGEPIVADLATMPHLLVAGTTGSGKSVGLNCILLSLLYRLTPAQCRLILVDPKVLELKSYDDIPHLLSPVVTEPAKAVRALKWAVEEMERRYRQMSELSVRNLAGFNEKVRAAAAKGKPLGRRIQIGFDPETGEELFEEQQLDYQVLPQIVVIVDELADLMVTVGKEVEVLIQRLSQKSRAAGIHLIMATQRPSVDVITGVIKANLPTRISFAVTSRIDSRTILGEQGAEQLLGKGDMLYKPNTDPIKRVHGPFVSDEEVERIADYWRSQGSPEYIDSVTEEPEDGGFGFDDLDATASDNPEERKYRQACQIVFESQKASASWLQRQLGVGYNTAAKWVERMEADGFVGPANHVGRRDIYRDRDGNPL